MENSSHLGIENLLSQMAVVWRSWEIAKQKSHSKEVIPLNVLLLCTVCHWCCGSLGLQGKMDKTWELNWFHPSVIQHSAISNHWIRTLGRLIRHSVWGCTDRSPDLVCFVKPISFFLSIFSPSILLSCSSSLFLPPLLSFLFFAFPTPPFSSFSPSPWISITDPFTSSFAYFQSFLFFPFFYENRISFISSISLGEQNPLQKQTDYMDT